MHAQSLTTSVLTAGSSLFGMSSGSIRFEPARDGQDPLSWSWNGILLHQTQFQLKLRQVSLVHRKDVFSVFEHVGALAMSRLRGVNIVTAGALPFIPFAGDIWDTFEQCMVEQPTQVLQPFSPPESSIHFCGNARDRFISYEPTVDETLSIRVEIDYPDIGALTCTYAFPDDELLTRVFRARTLGRLPAPLGFLEPLVGKYLRQVPVVAGAAWKYEYPNPDDLLAIIADHRCLDILGALSLCVPPGSYLTGNIHSLKGGHACDLKLVEHLRGANS